MSRRASSGSSDRWALAGFVLAGVTGGIGAGGVARLTVHGSPGSSYLELSGLPVFVAAGIAAAGVVGGWFVAMLLISRVRGGIRCPRCGTATTEPATECDACGLPMA